MSSRQPVHPDFPSRRRFLELTGAGAAGTLAAFAGLPAFTAAAAEPHRPATDPRVDDSTAVRLWHTAPAAAGKIPGVEVGIAPTVLGPDGKTRAVFSNSNGNNIWAGTKDPDLTWKWVSYMGSEACQSKASLTGTFFPSIPASMEASAEALKAEGVDLSVFTDMLNNKVLYPAPSLTNGAALEAAFEPLFEAYFAGEKGDSIFKDMQSQSKTILAEK